MPPSTPKHPGILAVDLQPDPPMNARSPLSVYRAKRHFEVTTEPSGDEKRAVASDRPRFMVHKHDATRLHYDLRLEIEGVLASWACPKGFSYDPAKKHLAVQTEDHPLEYGDFEGRIPDGEYGAGDSIIWDRGYWDTVPPGQAVAQLKKGHLHIQFEGEKLGGGFHLIRTRPNGGKAQWLIFKAKDGLELPGHDLMTERPESVVSGRRITRGPTRQSMLRGVHVPPENLLKKIRSPMLAVLSEPEQAPSSQYLYEVKYDGYRALAALSGGQLAVQSRNALDLLSRFPFVERALRPLVVGEAILDGEIIALDPRGRSDFQILGDPGAEHQLVVFDLLWLDGEDLRSRPLEERRELLESVVANAEPPLVLAERVEGTAEEALEAARARNLEGVIAKRRGSLYEATRSNDWRKLKALGTAELAIAGYTPSTNRDDTVGALLLASRKDGAWVFAGKVGTGFDLKTRKRLLSLLQPDEVEKAQIEGAPRLRKAHWVKPKHLAQLRFVEWTRDGKLRHPSFQGIREDKASEETQIEPPIAAPKRRKRPAAAPEQPRGFFGTVPVAGFGVWHSNRDEAAPATPPAAAPIEVETTHPERILFPKSKLTKADVRAYYDLVAAPLVNAMKGRPLSMQQWPRGITSPGFFRHAAANAPEWVTRVTIEHEEHPTEHIVIDKPQTLAWLANQTALTLHMTSSRIGSLDSPDWVAFDFDPADDDFKKVVPLARALHGLLEQLKLESHPKTSGKRGLHVFVPISAGHTFEQTHTFAQRITEALAERFPDEATTLRPKALRKGRLYLDAEQNARLKTMVAPYSIRAVEGGQVSTPLEWDEVDARLEPSRFTLKTFEKRLAKVGDLFAPVLRGHQALPTFND
jgi:bifunctional non-homologous end joining protein LigD